MVTPSLSLSTMACASTSLGNVPFPLTLARMSCSNSDERSDAPERSAATTPPTRVVRRALRFECQAQQPSARSKPPPMRTPAIVPPTMPAVLSAVAAKLLLPPRLVPGL